MKIAIVDTAHTGHHFEYIYGLSNQIKRNGSESEVDLFCDDRIYSYIIDNSLDPIDDIPHFNIFSNTLEHPNGGWLKQTWISYKNLKKLAAYSHVIFLYGNNYFPALALYGLMQRKLFSFTAIYFNPFLRNHPTFKDKFRNIILSNICKIYPNKGIFVLNDKDTVDKLNNHFNTTVFYTLEDPVPTFFYKDNNEIKFNDKNRLTYSMLGSLSKRKGIFEYLFAIEESNSKDKHILAGKLDEDISEEVWILVNKLKRKGIDIELINKFLTNKNFAQLIDKTNILVMPYLSKGASSGILGHASFRQKMVIGPSKGLLGDIIRNCKLGITINPANNKEFAAALRLGEDILINRDNELVSKYSTLNSYETFYNKLLKGLDKSKG